MRVEEIKNAVLYNAGEATARQVVMLQRYFLRKYCPWMTLRMIAEQTGSNDHTRVYDAVEGVMRSDKLFNIAIRVDLVISSLMAKKVINTAGVRLTDSQRKTLNDIAKIKTAKAA